MKRALAVGLVLVGCGGGGSSFDGNDASDVDGGHDSSYQFPEGGGEAGCVNLQCSQQSGTTISGVVYDPAGKTPLYDVYVYVPNATVAPIVPGNPVCSACQAAASGSPIASTVTDTNGKFVIANAPSGDNIPLVMQVGKWRRQITIAHVNAGVDNPQADPNQTRLPGKSSEGDMPLMALTTGGCDLMECWLEGQGIDQSEFVAPTSKTGHVHVYTGYGGSTIAGGYNQTQTYTWWMSAANLQAYDLLLEGCD